MFQHLSLHKTKLQRRLDFIYALVPVIEYLREIYMKYDIYTENIIDQIEDGDFTYILDIHRHFITIKRYLKGTDNTIRRKKSLVVEYCVLEKHPIHYLRILSFPIQQGYRTSLGEFTFYAYSQTIFQPNYCSYCDKYLTDLKKHCTCSRHKKKMKTIVFDALNHTKMNDDCLNAIIQYI